MKIFVELSLMYCTRTCTMISNLRKYESTFVLSKVHAYTCTVHVRVHVQIWRSFLRTAQYNVVYVYICNQILSYIEYVRVAHTCTEVLPYEGTVILPYFRTKISTVYFRKCTAAHYNVVRKYFSTCTSKSLRSTYSYVVGLFPEVWYFRKYFRTCTLYVYVYNYAYSSCSCTRTRTVQQRRRFLRYFFEYEGTRLHATRTRTRTCTINLHTHTVHVVYKQ